MGVSVVIPARNRPRVLARALQSVKAQTYRVDEIIVVDDASDDGLTPQIVLDAAATDPRFRLLRQPERRGASAARNVGWRAATADWIAFLDSDDKWADDKIMKQIIRLEAAANCAACFTGYQAIGHVEAYVYLPPKRVTLFALQRWNVLGTTSTAVVRRKVLEQLDGFDESLPSCQDWDLWIRIRKFGEIITIGEPLTLFEHAGDDRISKNVLNVKAGHKILFAKIRREIRNPVLKLCAISSHIRRMSQIYLYDFHNPVASLRNAVISLALFPNRPAIKLIKESIVDIWHRRANAHGKQVDKPG